MAVKVIYTDIDGTMVGPGGCFLKSADGMWTLEAAATLTAAFEAGIDVVFVSGRNRNQLRETGRVIGVVNYISELGAEIIYDQGKEIIPLVEGFETGGKTVYEAILDRGLPQKLFQKFGDKLEYHTPWSKEMRFYSHLLRGYIDLEEANTWLAENGHMDLKLVDNGQLASRSENLNHLAELHAYHLIPESVDKAAALRYDMKLRGFKRDETIALGDSWADLPLAGEVGTFYLMKNGVNADAALAAAIKDLDNVVVTDRPKTLGWSDSVREALSR
ncbi:MAG: HAD-IIB family hydrolase [Actinomycetota bacterium]